MRLTDSGAGVDDGDPVVLLSTGGGRTIKWGSPGGTVPACMRVGWLLLPAEPYRVHQDIGLSDLVLPLPKKHGIAHE